MVATCKRFHDIILESRDLNKNFELVFQESRWSKSPRLELLRKMDAEGPRKFKQLKIISVNAAYCSAQMGFRNIFNNLLGLKVCLTVESLIIRRCGYMEFPVLSEFLKMFPNLKSIEYRENKSLYSDGYQLSDIKQNKVSRDSTVDAVPLEPKDTPVFEHLTTLKYYSKDKFQCTNVFQNASRLKRLETNCPNFTTFSAFDNLEHLKIYFVYSLSYSSPTSNFFEDKIQNRIKFKLRSFSLGQQKVNNVFKFKITKFLETHSKTLEELTLKASNLPERAVQQILIMPNLRKLQVVFLLSLN